MTGSSSSLADLFARGNGRKTKWQGTTIYSVYQLPVSEGDIVTVRRISASPRRAQALKLAVDRGSLRANGIIADTVGIWTHTAPQVASVEVVGRRARSLDVWNSWSGDGVDSSWLANAAMVVDESGGTTVLRCSDGLGEPSFDDLVVSIEVGKDG